MPIHHRKPWNVSKGEWYKIRSTVRYQQMLPCSEKRITNDTNGLAVFKAALGARASCPHSLRTRCPRSQAIPLLQRRYCMWAKLMASAMKIKIYNLIARSRWLLQAFEFVTNLNARKFAFLYRSLKHCIKTLCLARSVPSLHHLSLVLILRKTFI